VVNFFLVLLLLRRTALGKSQRSGSSSRSKLPSGRVQHDNAADLDIIVILSLPKGVYSRMSALHTSSGSPRESFEQYDNAADSRINPGRTEPFDKIASHNVKWF
jgi:hypothetical protein